MNKSSVLIVDDDPAISDLVAQALKMNGYAARQAKNADAAFSAIASEPPDLVLLDINLPGISGLKLLDLLKKDAKTARLPVIMMTSHKKTETKVEGLLGGADDYIVKPFSIEELLARITALLRRVNNQGQADRILQVGRGAIRVDLDRFETTVSGKAIQLTPTEFKLLAILCAQPGRLFTYEALREALSDARDLTSGTLQSHVKNLRIKMGSSGDWIENIHGVGYKVRES
ncbi:MAG TPA: DNA-binding response regulator [Elusimicrobia bacterium]|nr:DNA-binding response regulator [Elusimicrobiota bacterium]HBT61343.1 DNA-binding response regulator [Elusimicrobiota bacterium]